MPISVANTLDGLLRRHFARTGEGRREVTQTIYFTNQDLAGKRGETVRARRYEAKPFGGFALNGNCAFVFEVKKEEPDQQFAKEWSLLSLAQIREKMASPAVRTELGGDQTARPLDRLVASQYERSHFVPKDSDGRLRITVDRNLSFWQIGPDGETAHLRSEPAQIVEIKYDNPDILLARNMSEFLTGFFDLHPQITVPKRSLALNFLKWGDKRKLPRLVKPEAVEIEAKFMVEAADPFRVLQSIKNKLREGQGGFFVSPEVPWTASKDEAVMYAASAIWLRWI